MWLSAFLQCYLREIDSCGSVPSYSVVYLRSIPVGVPSYSVVYLRSIPVVECLPTVLSI